VIGFRAQRSSQRGQALVEFALALPIVLLLMLGVLDLGRAVYAYNTVSNASRSAVRVAIVEQTEASVEAAARQEAVGLDPLAVAMSYPYDPGDCPDLDCIVRVTVTHDWAAATPLISGIVGPITISSTSELPIESVSP
jgi:Flp pilus assembly protein TadG